MLLAADEIARSLAGTWDLLQRRNHGLRRFDVSPSGMFRSFAALLLAAPAFVCGLAAERAANGVLLPDTSLFEDADLIGLTAGFLAIGWFVPLLTVCAFGRLLDLRPRVPACVAVCNWSSLLASFFLAVPAALFALGYAPGAVALFHAAAALVLIAHLRWFSVKSSLRVSGGVAGAIILADLATEGLLAGLLS